MALDILRHEQTGDGIALHLVVLDDQDPAHLGVQTRFKALERLDKLLALDGFQHVADGAKR